jgi:prolyl oligopeptidase
MRVTVPEWDSPIQQVGVSGNKLYLRYLVERKNSIRCWTLDGAWNEEINLPAGGTIQILPSLAPCSSFLYYSHESFAEPPSIHECWSVPPKENPPLSAKHGCPDAMRYRVDEVWYASHDGTQIPMSLVMRQDVDPLGASPAILTSYGGFGVAMTPRYSVLVTILLSLGAVFAVPSIRGGSEFGKAWHTAAKGRSRPLAFSDFIAGAEWLAQHSSTSARPLGIFGGSNSGLLVAVAMIQRPDLFRAVLSIAPLLDMVRYETFDRAKRWRHEFGSVGDAGDFKALFDYSPYHNISDAVNYPASLFVTGDQDDRCNPAHVRKMVARLQSRPLQTEPVLVDYSAERGHSPVLPLTVRTEALAKRIAFFCEELGIPISLGSDMP